MKKLTFKQLMNKYDTTANAHFEYKAFIKQELEKFTPFDAVVTSILPRIGYDLIKKKAYKKVYRIVFEEVNYINGRYLYDEDR